jgi:DNA-binding MarR family transcriptional regulator
MPKTREELLREIEVESNTSTTDGLFLFQAAAERSGMNLTDLQCVTILATSGPMSAGQLAEMMGLTTGAITGVVNRLERTGHVRREKDPGDARRVVIQPVTEELQRVGVDLFGSQREMMDTLLADYDDRDLALILDVFRKSNAMTRQQAARIRAASRGDDEGKFATPLGSTRNGRLVFANGTSRLSLRADSGRDDLYRAHFEGIAPKAKVEDGTVTFRYPRRLFGLLSWGNEPGEVTLNAAIPWEVEVRGGAYYLDADLRTLELTSFLLKGGVSNLDLTLPEPAGTVPVRLSGGASQVSIRRPAGVAARVVMKDGAAGLTFDEQRFDTVAPRAQLQSPDWDRGTDRYEIEVTGGASELAIG